MSIFQLSVIQVENGMICVIFSNTNLSIATSAYLNHLIVKNGPKVILLGSNKDKFDMGPLRKIGERLMKINTLSSPQLVVETLN